MEKTAIALAVTTLLTGCAASLENAGYEEYVVRATDKGYEMTAKSGKEYAERAVHFEAHGRSVSLTIGETGTKAFKGPAITAKAISVFPVTDLANILVGGERQGR
jgi:hypothetical protein